jgi:Ca-activated chloride channel family protein
MTSCSPTEFKTCNADPCALGNELEQSGVDFTAHVVGFGLTEEEGRAVTYLAENTGGKYLQASDAGTSVDALKTTVVLAEPAPAHDPVPAGQTTELDIIAQAGLAAIEGYYVPDMQIDGGSHAVIIYPAKMALDGSRERIETLYGTGAQSTLPPDVYIAAVELDLAVAEAPFTVKGGERVDVKVVLNVGVMAIKGPRRRADCRPCG